MMKTLAMLAVFATLSAGSAFGDEDACIVPMANWQSREALVQMTVDNGWTVRRIKIDDGCYEIYGRNAEGRRIEATIHPQSLQVIELEYEDHDDD